MTRKIKFRAWDKFTNRMISWDEMLEDESLIVEALLNGVRFYLMQFTGMHDKNGEEVYEGDLLLDDDSEPCVHQITWDGENAKYELLTQADENDWQNVYYNLQELISADNRLDDFTLAGNIFKNSEL